MRVKIKCLKETYHGAQSNYFLYMMGLLHNQKDVVRNIFIKTDLLI